MKKYRGYYIDHVVFNTTTEIDEFLKQQAIEAYRAAIQMFERDLTMEASTFASDIAERLVKQHGMTWEQVENIEIDTLRSIA